MTTNLSHFFFPRLYRNNLILGFSPTIFSVTLGIHWKIGWNVELRERDQDNWGNNLQIKTDLPNTWGPRFFCYLYIKKKFNFWEIQNHLCYSWTFSLRTPLQYRHLDNKNGGQSSISRSNSAIFSSLIRNLTDIEDNKDNAPWASDNYGLFILGEKKHSCACSCSYGHFNLENYTVLNLMKRTNPL